MSNSQAQKTGSKINSANANGEPVLSGLLGRLNPTWALALISLLGLFLEMLLIRWIGTEVRIFAYLQNTVLVVCILGLGMGCFTCRKPAQLSQMLTPLLILTSILAIPATRQLAAGISDHLSVLSDLVIWNQSAVSDSLTGYMRVGLGLSMTLVLMLLLWEIFVPVGRILGRLFDDHPHTIKAYSINVIGSLLGIWLFAGLSSLYASPWIWFSAVALLAALFVGTGRERILNLTMLGAVVALAWFAGRDSTAMDVVWSPYQKLELRDNRGNPRWPGEYLITVNNTGYQGMIDLRPETVAGNPRIKADEYGYSQYDLPLKLKPNPRKVLIVGAGSGNDVAGALRGGAERVTAVEIDPAIIAIGKKFHPEHPYASDRVTVVNDDARSFFATTRDTYDLIIFGLLDSHTTSSMTNARLDHYVYTRESIAQARSLLTPDGVMVLSFDATRPFVAQRMENCLTEVFGRSPLSFVVPPSFSGWGGTMFVTGNREAVESSLATQPRLAEKVADWSRNLHWESNSASIETASDDWPYIYLEQRQIPTLYYLLAFLLGVIMLYSKFRLGSRNLRLSCNRSEAHFFFLGAAFMLLEVHSISKAAVVLGNTWLVNGVIVSGILVMILFANVVAARRPRLSQSFIAGGLLLTCLAEYCVDLSQFAFLPYVAKSIVVGLFCAVPMFFSGLLFVRSFRRSDAKDKALGANLIGSLVGGLLQSLTFVTGLNALMLLVAALYSAALLTREKKMDSSPPRKEPFKLDEEFESSESLELVEV